MDICRSSTYPDRDINVSRISRFLTQRAVRLLGVVGLASLAALTPGCHELDMERAPQKRGSVGEEMYGVICDRVGAQALREDLSGASFRNVCHRSFEGKFADQVDKSKLPPLDPEAVNEEGAAVSLEKQKNDRARAVGRVEALGRRRTDLIRAFDATFPPDKIAVRDLDNPDPGKSCDMPKKSQGLLTEALADMLGRMGDLYNDGTIPQSTRSLSRVIGAFEKSEEAQLAWSRVSARQGYRPIDTALGTARPILAYPNMRDFANASLSILSADSRPYDPNARRDAEGKRILVAGSGNAALNKLLETAHEELLAAKPEPRAPALVVTNDANTTRVILSRPRDNLEILQNVLFAEDDAFATGTAKGARFIVRRDDRGYARIRGGALPQPFVDQDNDGLPDVDGVGRFITGNKSIAPAPFAFPGAPQAPRDQEGRVTVADGLLYDYLDTSRTFAAQLVRDLKPLVNPDPEAKHETLMDLAGGIPIVLGPRETRTKKYDGDRKLTYDGIRTKDSPLLDLVYAMGTILGDRTGDQTLALVRELFTTQARAMARVTGATNAAFDAAQKHPEAKIPTKSTFWDENLETLAKLVKEPGLLEDIMRALAAPESQGLGNTYARFTALRDEITYDENDVNGATFNVTTKSNGPMVTPVDRSAPITGTNRSAFFRFVGLINDTMGVTTCNKPDARVHALGLSLPVAFQECEVFKIENLAAFYLDAIANAQQYSGNDEIPRGTIYLRPSILRLAPGITTILENSSGITGFWPASGNIVAPTPKFLNRLVFFDVKNDTKNEKTRTFVGDLQGRMGTSVCPEREINDPSPDAADASPDGKVHGLRNCPESQWLDQRGKNTIFTWEHFNFYEAMRPLLGAFAKHKREDLFLELTANVYRHFPGADASEDECKLPNNGKCTREGMNSYEGLLSDALVTDIFPALGELSKALETMAIRRCDAADPTTQQCTQSTFVSGIDVVAAAARSALDPDHARQIALTDRLGQVTALRNDGTTVPQVTPAYLMTNALHAIDVAFDRYEEQNPSDKDRRVGWRRARSQLIDQFLGTTGTPDASAFTNPSVPKMTPVLVDMIRSQLFAHCPRSFVPPYETCAWARTELTKNAEATLAGPLTITGVDILDAIRKDPDGRRETERLLTYLVDEASNNEALANVLASTNDAVQLLRDDENLIPLFKVLAAAVDTTKYDDKGRIVEKSLVDAQMALLARIYGKYFDKEGNEICRNEIDPNQVLAKVLANAVTPIKDGEWDGQSPLEVIIDVIADVNRQDPTQPYEGTLERKDYASVSANVIDFLTNKERGLEQFYEIIHQCTKP
jgi:hypothetical protein